MRMILSFTCIALLFLAPVSKGDSFVNPWDQFKVFIEIKEGTSTSNALAKLMRLCKKKDALLFSATLEPIQVTIKSRLSSVRKDFTVNQVGLGLAINRLADASGLEFSVSEKSLVFFERENAPKNLKTSRFVSVPETVRKALREGISMEVVLRQSGIELKAGDKITLDKPMRLMIFEGEVETRKKIEELFAKKGQ